MALRRPYFDQHGGFGGFHHWSFLGRGGRSLDLFWRSSGRLGGRLDRGGRRLLRCRGLGGLALNAFDRLAFDRLGRRDLGFRRGSWLGRFVAVGSACSPCSISATGESEASSAVTGVSGCMGAAMISGAVIAGPGRFVLA